MRLEGLILDMDGVLWHGDVPMAGLADFFATLRRLEIDFILATNNATKVAAQYSDKLARFGVVVPAGQILTSAEATAGYLQGLYPAGTPIFVVGDSGLRLALQTAGFQLVSGDGFDLQADLVVAGLSRELSYPQLAQAAALIRRGAPFIATNNDKTFPSEFGPMPGAGAVIAFLEAATDVRPTIIGKPGRIMFAEAIRRLGSDPAHIAMVGDRLETDIAGAKAAGLQAILLLSGVSGREDLATASHQPDLVLADISQLAHHLSQQQA